jgi:signal transduction histidine kinase
VHIQLAVANRSFTLAVEDDGRGFATDRRGSGHGLTSLRHRSTLLHGNLELASQPGRGTRIAFSGLLHPPAPASVSTP